MEDELMTSGEAAKHLGVSVRRVNELAETGKIERQRVGTFWLYHKSSLDAWKQAPKSKGGRPKASAGTPILPAIPA